jgi:hypothetical protein
VRRPNKKIGKKPVSVMTYRKLGQKLVVCAILINGLVLAISIHLAGLQNDLQNKRYDEQYFIINQQGRRTEHDKYIWLKAHSNQLVLLRRLADTQLTSLERTTILNNTKELNHESEVSRLNEVALAYILAHDPPMGMNLLDLFRGKSDDELSLLQNQYEEDAGNYASNLKKEMNKLEDSIKIWQYIFSTALVLSSIILIIGSILKYPSEVAETGQKVISA